jgi:ABC-2 type transport system ATP-binding protein
VTDLDARRPSAALAGPPSIAVRCQGLSKSFGTTRAVDGLDLEVRTGEVLGLLGPNGAGKTTTIRLLLDLIRPTSGSVEVFGLDVRRHSVEVRRRVGYLPSDLSLPGRMTGAEVLRYLGDLRGGVDAGAAHALADRFEIDLDRRVAALSKGNRQKVGLIQAFQHHPDLYVLDEPTSGLDPLVQHAFRDLVREVVDAGATVLLSSHVLGEVQQLADRVAVIRQGRLVAVEAVDELHARAVRRIQVRFAGPADRDTFASLPGVADIAVDGPTLRCTLVGDADAFVKAAARHHVVSITSDEPDLEELFLHLYQEPDR